MKSRVVDENTSRTESIPSFRSLYNRYSGPIHRYLLAKTGQSEVADDITQEVFLALWKTFGKSREIQEYDAWLYRVARNKLVDFYRHKAREASLPWRPDICSGLQTDESASDQLTPDEYREARDGLSEERQKLLDLIYYFRLTYEEAARLIQVPIGTFKRRMYDVRSQLRLLAGRGEPKVLTGSVKRKLPTTRVPPVQYDLPDMDRVKVANIRYHHNLTADVYYPPTFRFSKELPVVLFAMGFSNEEFQSFNGINLKDMACYRSWGQLVAASGMIGITYETDEPFDDIHTVMDFILDKGPMLGMDSARICIWTASGNIATALEALTETQRPYASSIRCGVIYYPIFNRRKRMIHNGLSDELRPDVPLFYVAVGKEAIEKKQEAERFACLIQSSVAPVEYIYYEEGVHGFDLYVNNQRARDIVDRTLAFMTDHLGCSAQLS